ncbi:SIMPL domain-containing protein [Mycolicibacterium sp. F2034L]|uniref:SIMPL domain-containing protein n=1 Tax=Mycolicibacterium sp. F2034L TaxID=2926422 RepID=UPI001FF6B609|nr:SIMPL domain-containing protein [Mycolicibacterium sp. F2034L]MCK0176919.1 SIMPL domain-containing protein [Mycolicibacterium sp. F2034L]
MPIPAFAKTRLLPLIAAALAVAGVAACDATSGPTPGTAEGTRQVTVVGQGQVQGTPDTLTANVGMEAIAPDVTGAMNESSERQQAVITALVDAGISREDISTTQVSLQPQFGTDGTAITGYRASNQIDVKIRDVSTASQALALIVSSGGDATRINSIDYSIEDDSQLIRDARARAFEDAKSRARQYADLSGMDLGKVVSISESSGSMPPPQPMPMRGAEAAMAVPMEPGQQTVGFNVTVIWELD